MVAAVAVLLGMATGPRPEAQAAGDSLQRVSITRFCRSRIYGSAESASFKLSITLTNSGAADVQGELVVWSAAMAPAVQSYYDLDPTTDGPVLLQPGKAINFVAIGREINLARTTKFAAGIGNTYAYTPWYAGSQDIPAC